MLFEHGHLLPDLAAPLAAAGLSGLNVSVDTLDPERFHALTGRGDLGRVLAGIDTAIASGIPVKTNAVALITFSPGTRCGGFSRPAGLPVACIQASALSSFCPQSRFESAITLQASRLGHTSALLKARWFPAYGSCSANARAVSPAPSTAERMLGRVTSQKVCHSLA